MADLDLQLTATGKHDFVVDASGDLVRTDDPFPAILRLLLQDPWIGDDGERAGQSLGSIKLITSTTKAQVQRIAEVRLAALIRSGQITAVQVLSVQATDGKVFATISVTVAGKKPRSIQVPLV